MHTEVITKLDQVTSAWLTAALYSSGALSVGKVADFGIAAAVERELSANARLRLRYTSDALGSRPQDLFLKMVTLDQEDEWLQASEVYYYTRDYVGVLDVPLLRCYDAAYSEELGCFHILVDDVSETHVRAFEKPVTPEFGLALADGLAALHAHWWGRKRLEQGGAPLHAREVIERFVAIARPGVEHILSCCRDELQPQWPDMIVDIFERHPAMLILRNQDAVGFTLIHGDAGDSNILVPKSGDRPIYIIDRGPFDWSLTTWLGVYDLSYAMVLDWPVAVRRELEEAVLRRYHEQLVKRGINDYSWTQLYEDYRLMAPMNVYIASEYCRGGPNLRAKHVWMSYLQRALTACEDLGWSLSGHSR